MKCFEFFHTWGSGRFTVIKRGERQHDGDVGARDRKQRTGKGGTVENPKTDTDSKRDNFGSW